MSDELLNSVNDSAEEYEEITSEEVDRVVGVLEQLMESVESENIKALLEEASSNIFYLIYDIEIEDEAAGDNEVQGHAA